MTGAVQAGGPILTVNAGSTSLKLALVDPAGGTTSWDDLDQALAGIARDGTVLAAVAHRIVHGGTRWQPAVIDDGLRRALDELVELAPLHQPPALHAIDAVRAALPDVPHVACFDTAFHHTLPPEASTYALPARLRERVRVYGFHGLSFAWASSQVKELVPEARRVLIAHLGGGASLCAVLDGRSVATTMGFTPLDGLVMATRSGRLDPGAVLWMAEHTTEDLGQVLERESGLLGLCGTRDIREVLHRNASGDPDAQLALGVYLHRFGAEAAGMAAAMGGLDVVVLTGGIGEHSGPMHALLLERLAWLGVRGVPDDQAVTLAESPDKDLTAMDSAARVLVIPAREDLQLATEARTLLAQ